MEKLISEYMYWLGTVKIFNFLKSLNFQDFLKFTEKGKS